MARKFSLPDLPYDYKALEPIISGEIMQLHHQKHHQGYVNGLNTGLEKYEQAETKDDLTAMIAVQPVIRFNGGGHINHTLFWQNLAPKNKGGGEAPKGEIAEAIQKQWDSVDKFVEQFNGIAAPLQGSGWCWLAFNKATKILQIQTTSNQDPLEGTTGLVPLLGIDVWEHAYYLQYKNARPDYLRAIWQVVNWSTVNERFKKFAEECITCR
jgi:superoxide dismutase, Fe-Mn family